MKSQNNSTPNPRDNWWRTYKSLVNSVLSVQMPPPPAHTHYSRNAFFKNAVSKQLGRGDNTELKTGEDKPMERVDQKCLVFNVSCI